MRETVTAAAPAKAGDGYRQLTFVKARPDGRRPPDSVKHYGQFISALANKITASPEEADAAAVEIFTDIWRYSKKAERFQLDEFAVVNQIARWRLVRYLHSGL